MIHIVSRILKQTLNPLTSRRRRRTVLSTIVAMVESLEPRKMLSGNGFVIKPTFDAATIGALPNHAAIEATINNVISLYEATFSDPITVNITFKGTTDPNSLAFSTAGRDSVPYQDFLKALKNGATTADDATAVAHLPNTTNEPVQNQENVGISTANEKALGLIAANAAGNDGTITLNFSSMNVNRTTVDPDKYDLAATAAHEMDEVLGTGSNMPDTGDTWIEDLFRYAANGQRSYTTSPSAKSFFSLDGQNDVLPFNQVGNDSDYGDWASGPVPHVQDAFGTTGQDGIVDPNVEFRVLDVLGYHLIAKTVNHAPTGTSATVSAAVNSNYVFKVADFGFRDPNDTPPNALKALKITLLPNAGALMDAGVAVAVNQFVPVSDIQSGKLVFEPEQGLTGGPFFLARFQVQDNGGTAGGGKDLDPTAKTLDIRVGTPNHAPVGTSLTATTTSRVHYTLKVSDFGFTDPHDTPPNGFLAVKITLLPNAGTLTDNGVKVTANQLIKVSDIASGKLTLTLKPNLGTGTFFLCRFQVQDNGGTAGGGVDLDPNPKVLQLRVL